MGLRQGDVKDYSSPHACGFGRKILHAAKSYILFIIQYYLHSHHCMVNKLTHYLLNVLCIPTIRHFFSEHVLSNDKANQ